MQSTPPIDVPQDKQSTFTDNLQAITKGTDRLAMFSADQKIEHLHSVDPHKLFYIAQHGHMGAFATHLGLIHRYATKYRNINYIVKMDGKSNLRGATYDDPYSHALWGFEHVLDTRENTSCQIRGIGYTVYLGSAYEAYMLAEAAQLVHHAHQEGLVAIIWMYPRGEAVQNEKDPEIITGAAAAATSIGADFVKVKVPDEGTTESAQQLKHVTASAGNTHVICSGGPRQDAHAFLHELETQLRAGNTAGCAVGRNIFTRETQDAIYMTQAIADITYNDMSTEEAYKILI